MTSSQDDVSNLSDDVFEDMETTQRRIDEKRRRREDEYNNSCSNNSNNLTTRETPTTYVDASGSVVTDYNVPHQHYHQHLHQQLNDVGVSGVGGGGLNNLRSISPSGYPGYRPPRDALQLYALGEPGYHYEDEHDYEDDWRSYRYEEVGMQPVPQPQPPQPFDDTVSHKTILLGDSGVGKTSFLVKYNTGEFRLGSFSATVGIALTNKIVVVDGTRVKLQIWDTAGQERFRSVTHAYYRDAHALLLLYDVTNRTTFDNIRAWLGEIRYYAQDDVVILLIGNKADCNNSERQVKREDGERLAQENDVPFMETSAKSGLNVELAFTAVARQLKNGGYRTGMDGQFNVHDFVRDNSNAPNMCEQCKAF